MKNISIILICFAMFASNLWAELEPTRDKGVSIHMLPKRVADLDAGSNSLKWGLGISTIAGQRVPRNKHVFQAAEKLVEFYHSLPKETQDNGIWIVTTDPDAYSDEEVKLLDAVKQLCLKEKISLFICRGSELSSGWKRVVADVQAPKKTSP